MDLDLTHPAVSDLRDSARKRLPRFAFEFLDSATGTELGMDRNRRALDSIGFMPAILRGKLEAELTREFMDQVYSLPVGIAPVGMSGMIWPGAERKLAKVALERNIPYCMSTVAVATPEEIGPCAGAVGWFQLYPPECAEVRRHIIKRVRDSGFRKLVVTVDVPADSRRERQRRAHIALPPKLTTSMIVSMALHPYWSLAMALNGVPRLKLAESYVPKSRRGADKFRHVGKIMRGQPDWDYLAAIRQEWEDDLLVKGILDPDDAVRMVEAGIDGIWVSNHSARQFEAGPTSIVQLPKIREAVGYDVPIIFDSGVSGGMDVLRAIALGADFVFLGRAFHYAIAALGERGIHHLLHILDADMRSNMAQIGINSLDDLADRLILDSR
ncbi:MAG: alpha-hydroxy acid oxidase [Albidovulum sp.]|nr:alpha-hydroxy acid oxidase [Albidovulum sp.]MDE0533732.1 alpha-hydroxy acid oxidase [Albidovulum sp.]